MPSKNHTNSISKFRFAKDRASQVIKTHIKAYEGEYEGMHGGSTTKTGRPAANFRIGLTKDLRELEGNSIPKSAGVRSALVQHAAEIANATLPKQSHISVNPARREPNQRRVQQFLGSVVEAGDSCLLQEATNIEGIAELEGMVSQGSQVTQQQEADYRAQLQIKAKQCLKVLQAQFCGISEEVARMLERTDGKGGNAVHLRILETCAIEARRTFDKQNNANQYRNRLRSMSEILDAEITNLIPELAKYPSLKELRKKLRKLQTPQHSNNADIAQVKFKEMANVFSGIEQLLKREMNGNVNLNKNPEVDLVVNLCGQLSSMAGQAQYLQIDHSRNNNNKERLIQSNNALLGVGIAHAALQEEITHQKGDANRSEMYYAIMTDMAALGEFTKSIQECQEYGKEMNVGSIDGTLDAAEGFLSNAKCTLGMLNKRCRAVRFVWHCIKNGKDDLEQSTRECGIDDAYIHDTELIECVMESEDAQVVDRRKISTVMQQWLHYQRSCRSLAMEVCDELSQYSRAGFNTKEGMQVLKQLAELDKKKSRMGGSQLSANWDRLQFLNKSPERITRYMRRLNSRLQDQSYDLGDFSDKLERFQDEAYQFANQHAVILGEELLWNSQWVEYMQVRFSISQQTSAELMNIIQNGVVLEEQNWEKVQTNIQRCIGEVNLGKEDEDELYQYILQEIGFIRDALHTAQNRSWAELDKELEFKSEDLKQSTVKNLLVVTDVLGARHNAENIAQMDAISKNSSAEELLACNDKELWQLDLHRDAKMVSLGDGRQFADDVLLADIVNNCINQCLKKDKDGINRMRSIKSSDEVGSRVQDAIQSRLNDLTSEELSIVQSSLQCSGKADIVYSISQLVNASLTAAVVSYIVAQPNLLSGLEDVSDAATALFNFSAVMRDTTGWDLSKASPVLGEIWPLLQEGGARSIEQATELARNFMSSFNNAEVANYVLPFWTAGIMQEMILAEDGLLSGVSSAIPGLISAFVAVAWSSFVSAGITIPLAILRGYLSYRNTQAMKKIIEVLSNQASELAYRMDDLESQVSYAIEAANATKHSSRQSSLKPPLPFRFSNHVVRGDAGYEKDLAEMQQVLKSHLPWCDQLSRYINCSNSRSEVIEMESVFAEQCGNVMMKFGMDAWHALNNVDGTQKSPMCLFKAATVGLQDGVVCDGRSMFHSSDGSTLKVLGPFDSDTKTIVTRTGEIALESDQHNMGAWKVMKSLPVRAFRWLGRIGTSEQHKSEDRRARLFNPKRQSYKEELEHDDKSIAIVKDFTSLLNQHMHKVIEMQYLSDAFIKVGVLTNKFHANRFKWLMLKKKELELQGCHKISKQLSGGELHNAQQCMQGAIKAGSSANLYDAMKKCELEMSVTRNIIEETMVSLCSRLGIDKTREGSPMVISASDIATLHQCMELKKAELIEATKQLDSCYTSLGGKGFVLNVEEVIPPRANQRMTAQQRVYNQTLQRNQVDDQKIATEDTNAIPRCSFSVHNSKKYLTKARFVIQNEGQANKCDHYKPYIAITLSRDNNKVTAKDVRNAEKKRQSHMRELNKVDESRDRNLMRNGAIATTFRSPNTININYQNQQGGVRRQNAQQHIQMQ